MTTTYRNSVNTTECFSLVPSNVLRLSVDFRLGQLSMSLFKRVLHCGYDGSDKTFGFQSPKKLLPQSS
ncbi:predicted protein [Botrytis cinerea T4]|uniref:Uncharacterized protein n=1 Tax=Botryotinia fuckeliana (strain T4) TaxID=999810 RepID=G2Y1B2_BOTF4|nr:predicted protein [Botrytis cinerea T4]